MKHLLILLIIVPASLFGQSYLGLGVHLGGFARSGDWADRYGPAFVSGGKIEFGGAKGLILAAQGDVMFGQQVKIDPLSGLRNDVGVITGDIITQGTLSEISLLSRGYRASLLIGYQHQLNPNGIGIRAVAGPSYMSHFIRIQDDANQTTNNLRDEYKKGYDRNAGGFGAYGEMGVQYVQANGSYRIAAVLTGSVSSTSALNSTQFDLNAVGPADGTDVSLGGRVSLVLGLFRNADGKKAEDIYY